MNDLISRKAALSEIGRSTFVGEAYRKVRQIPIETVPSAQPEIIECLDCVHYEPLARDKSWGRCSVHSGPTENPRMCQSCDFCAWAERRTDERFNQPTGGD